MCTGGDRVRRDRLRRLPVPAERVRTVQGELEEALNRLTGERTRVRFAGRTDAGVHATGQVAAFCLARRRRGEGIGWPELRRRLNAALPPDLAVRSLRPASAGFDPRRDAEARVYRYRIRMAGDKRPTDRHRTLEIGDRLDVAAMRAVAAELPGERDFAALGSDAAGPNRPSPAGGVGRAARNLRGDPGHGQRVPEANGAQHRGPPPGGGAREAGTGIGRRAARRGRARPSRARGTGARADPRAGHLFEYDVGEQQDRGRRQRDRRTQSRRARSSAAGGWWTPPTRRWVASPRASPRCSRESTSRSTRRTSTPATTWW